MSFWRTDNDHVSVSSGVHSIVTDKSQLRSACQWWSCPCVKCFRLQCLGVPQRLQADARLLTGSVCTLLCHRSIFSLFFDQVHSWFLLCLYHTQTVLWLRDVGLLHVIMEHSFVGKDNIFTQSWPHFHWFNKSVAKRPFPMSPFCSAILWWN